ncbi:DegV family EDD domain-containing protein [Oceanispirochaeta crateris]|uniref:DegV family EDD domain-containing protein n=1 Tax=Oceanispirochaeta crateris TaxID=2518645 RepID=A0A5C1QN10_9SPIO|nr:DegV family protein [Oceanispirochaeta crateris]QEN08718.1 DegV family EDD domain-containing protein [Oceanispirochaeta crateris]
MMKTVNGVLLYNAFLAGYFKIDGNREYMNQINVFPVRDGDTGSNIVSMFRLTTENLVSCKSVGKLMNRIARLSLEGARGNSGMIISQFLNSMSKNIFNKETISLPELGKILQMAANDAYEAVENPQEGTILTVMKIWADSFLENSAKDMNLEDIMNEALVKAKEALDKTQEQLSVLKENNVVDAGAWGFVCFLEGIAGLGHKGILPLAVRKTLRNPDIPMIEPTKQSVHIFNKEIKYRYCTEVLMADVTTGQEELKEILNPLGDSLIVTSGLERTRIHIHTNKPQNVIAEMYKVGRIIQQKADDMIRQEQVVNKRIAKVAVVTDSIADLSHEILDQFQIHVINLHLHWDDEEYLDRLTIRPDDFYTMQSYRTSFPSSSFPPGREVEMYYEYLLDHYEALIVLSVAKELSGTWQRMKLSAEKFNTKQQKIAVVDTCLNSVAQGLLVKMIAQKAAEGSSLNELVEAAEELKSRIRIFVMVKTFKFMIKGGRVSPLKGFIAKILNLKPIVSLDQNGKGVAFEKSFSSRGLMKKITRLVSTIEGDNGIEEYAIVHASARERAEKWGDFIHEITRKSPSYITDISPIVGMHSGKGAIAIGLVEKKKRRS